MTTIQPTAPDKLWTPANIVTLIRICLVPVFVLAILSPWPEWVGLPGITMEAKCVIAAGIFILISCTDWIDGYLARSRGEVTDFGKFMDPLADKILVTAALIALVELAVLPGWPVLIILAREFIVSGIRMVAADAADAACGPRIAERIGKGAIVLVEGTEEDGQRFGRAQCQAPEVDGVTYVSRGEIGAFVSCTIADTLLYEMEGE